MAPLTPEEEAEFTPLNAAAFDLIRANAQRDNVIPPCWLCMSDEAKQEARDEVVIVIGKALDILAPCENGIRNLLKGKFGEQVTLWRNAEAELKEARLAGNPKAYFVPTL